MIGRAGLDMGGTQLQSAERAARALIEAEPYRESGYVLLMQALAARGNVAEAMRVFDALRTLLRDELGTSPSPEAIAAHDRLLRPARARLGGGPAVEAGGAGVAIPLPADLRHRAQAPLIGRERELAELEAFWELAAGPDGSGQLVLLAGDAGIGKTTLTAELARRVHEAGAIVLAGRSPRETVVPYQPILEALRHWALNAPATELSTTAREYGSELARLIPELRRRAPDLPPPPLDEPETERYRLFEAVVGLLTELSRSAPVLLVLDDLQWADRPTLLLLRHLARATTPARLLILGAYRADRARGDTFTERPDRAAPRPARLAAGHPRPERGRDRRAGRRCAPARRPRGRSRARCTRRPRATRSSSRRSSATCSRPGCTRAARAPPTCSASGCPRASSRSSRGGSAGSRRPRSSCSASPR